MTARLTREQADWLVGLPKHIDEPIRWARVQEHGDRYAFRVPILGNELRTPASLIGNLGKTNWSFILMIDPDTPIRKLTVHGGAHTNPDGSDAGTHHKHIWDEVHRDKETYYPDDIDFSDINAALLGFLSECNITVSRPPERLTMEGRLR